MDGPTLILILALPVLCHLACGRHLRRHGSVLAVEAVVAALVLPALVSGRTIGVDPAPLLGMERGALTRGSQEQVDLPLQFVVWWEEVRRQAAAGGAPWIAPGIGGGVPLLANGQTGVGWPLQAPVWLVGAEQGTAVMAVWKLLLASLGGVALLRRWRVRRSAALSGGIAFGCGLYMLSWLVVPLTWVVAASPWAWYLLVGALRGSRREMAGLAVLLGFLSGGQTHPETAAFLWLSLAIGGLVLAWGRRRRVGRLAVTLAMGAPLAVGLGLPSLLAILESSKFHAAASRVLYPDPGFTLGFKAELARLLLLPWLPGHPADGAWRLAIPAAPVSLAVGLAPFVALAAAFPARRHRRAFLALAAVGLLGLVLVYQIPGPAHVLGRLPVLAVMVWVRAGFLPGFALALAAALALDRVLGRRLWRRWLAASLAIQAVVLALLLAQSEPAAGRVWRGALAPLVLAAATPALALGKGGVVAGLVMAEVVGQGAGLLPARSLPGHEDPPPVIVELRGRVHREGGRVLVQGPLPAPNLLARWGLEDLRSNDPIRPEHLADLHESLGADGRFLPEPVSRPWAGLAGAWGVRWLVAPPSGPLPPADGSWEVVGRGPYGTILRNPRAKEVLRLVSRVVPSPGDPGEGGWEEVDFSTTAVGGRPRNLGGAGRVAEVIRHAPHRWEARVVADGPVLAALHMPSAAGWRVTVNGRKMRPELVNMGAMAVELQAGESLVEWRYSPPGLVPGLLLAALSLAACWLVAALRRRP